MTVGELISKIVDSYVDIVVDERDEKYEKGRRYTITKHSSDFRNIPEDLWNSEVDMILPYYDRIKIEVMLRKEENMETVGLRK